MNISELGNSTLLKKEDVEPAILLTIKSVEKEQIQGEDALKYVMRFMENDKGLVLNKTNGERLAVICGSKDSPPWIGKKIVLFNDTTVEFGGKITGGVRVRAPKNQTADQTPEVPAKEEDFADDIPF